ncbi:XRE family transcriptional regulator [Cryobacterium sp. MDB1-18-2]|nr:XRE family transcriptional regulator [Cryobacterium sp. MDB1-18-2]
MYCCQSTLSTNTLHFMEMAMARKARTYSPWTVEAITILGQQITAERRLIHWRQRDIAERAGISAGTLIAIEKGSTATSIGTVFEVAALLGIPLVGATEEGPRELINTRLALLPTRMRLPTEYDDDF